MHKSIICTLYKYKEHWASARAPIFFWLFCSWFYLGTLVFPLSFFFNNFFLWSFFILCICFVCFHCIIIIIIIIILLIYWYMLWLCRGFWLLEISCMLHIHYTLALISWSIKTSNFVNDCKFFEFHLFYVRWFINYLWNKFSFGLFISLIFFLWKVFCLEMELIK